MIAKYSNKVVDPLYLLNSNPLRTLIHEITQFSSPFTPSNNPHQLNQTQVIVIGSGFGGRIITLFIVNQFTEEDKLKFDSDKRKIVIFDESMVG